MKTPSSIHPLRTFCWGVLHAIGMFSISKVTGREKREEPGGFFAVDSLTLDELLDSGEENAWFSLGEVVMAGMLAATIAVPAGFWFATRTELPLAFIGAAVLYLPLFVFLPKLIRQAMNVETEEVLIAFGKNEQVKKVFWALFVATAGLVLAQIVDPEAAQKILGIIAGIP